MSHSSWEMEKSQNVPQQASLTTSLYGDWDVSGLVCVLASGHLWFFSAGNNSSKLPGITKTTLSLNTHLSYSSDDTFQLTLQPVGLNG